jgi:hypothetical protein
MVVMDRDDAATPIELTAEDYYLEGETLVFTAAFHLKRANCGGSGCRHCPFGHCNVPGVAQDQRPDVPLDPSDAG